MASAYAAEPAASRDETGLEGMTLEAYPHSQSVHKNDNIGCFGNVFARHLCLGRKFERKNF